MRGNKIFDLLTDFWPCWLD